MKIKVLGPGCANCNKLEKLTVEVIQELGLDAQVEKITDIKAIAQAGVLMTPGLIVDEQIKVSGKVPSKAALKEMLASSCQA